MAPKVSKLLNIAQNCFKLLKIAQNFSNQQSFWQNPPKKIIEHFSKNARKWQKAQEKLHNRAKTYNNRLVREIGRNKQKFQKYTANVRKFQIFKEATKKD